MKDSVQESYKSIVAQELQEGNLRNIAVSIGAAAAIAGTSMLAPVSDAPKHQVVIDDAIKKVPNEVSKFAGTILDKFKIDPDKAHEIAKSAIKHSDPVFPQTHHLLALAGIESSFNDKAVSKLKFDQAIGLTQIRPKIWNIHPDELSTIDGQMKHAAHILKSYHQKTGSIESAVKSYNVGITNFRRGKQYNAANRYLTKFNNELSRYKD